MLAMPAIPLMPLMPPIPPMPLIGMSMGIPEGIEWEWPLGIPLGLADIVPAAGVGGVGGAGFA
jgi:hypothetical protein